MVRLPYNFMLQPSSTNLEYCVIKQHRILGDHAHSLPQGGLGHMAYVLVVDENGAVGDVIKAEEKPGQGRFARACCTLQAAACTGGGEAGSFGKPMFLSTRAVGDSEQTLRRLQILSWYLLLRGFPENGSAPSERCLIPNT